MDDYEYEHLPDVSSYIRLVDILPGEPHEDIMISLNTVHLETFEGKAMWDGATTRLHYEVLAIAHVPALSLGQEHVFVVTEGQETCARLPVTGRLAKALRSVRLANVPRTMWIDAISINLNDDNELELQSAKRARIVDRASHVEYYPNVKKRDVLQVPADWKFPNTYDHVNDVYEHCITQLSE